MSQLDKIIGNEVVLSYYDHNEIFAKCLPQMGKLVSRHETGNVNDWFLLSLNKSIQYAGTDYKALLIRSKWQEQSISSKEATGVFILLVPPAEIVPKRITDIEAYEHVAWGFANVSDT